MLQLTRPLANMLYRRNTLFLLLLLTPPLLWFGVVYLGSLFSLLWQSFYTFDSFSMSVTPDLTLENYRSLFDATNLDIILRTLTMAVSVTLATAVIGFPIAYYMTRYGSHAEKGFFYVAVMLPMWASYIVKTYAWTVILSQEGILYWLVNHLGLLSLLNATLAIPSIGGNTLATSNLGRFIVFTYIWLPFMILPIQAALERVPSNLLQASSDLGAKPAQTFRKILLPLVFPGVVAGSIFTFSLTLGDYIIPQLIGPSGLFIGTMVYTMQGSIGNMPLAAAFTVVPIVLIFIYLALAKRMGAFDAF
ncbi:ABC transporter permease [Methyloradius palustris]|uniref:ABC transporter permease n=1 Tax=Methyloradius palustris TaxID=2778876 RepID=A0A8D5JWE1_9PROT|nr:ABC transporter permease [Methyloradius palustris]BCM25004.1 ABC transporter permease [Methyloradius palustris]